MLIQLSKERQMDRSLHQTSASDGQALLLAVLIMIAILLIGSLFVAVVVQV